MLSLGILASKVTIAKGDPDLVLEERYGEKLGHIISYKWVELSGDYKIIIPEFYDIKDHYEIEASTEDDAFTEVVSKFADFTYLEHQSDPNKLFSEGGNCQAVSLYVYDTFKRAGYDTGLVLEESHMFPWVEINGVKYQVDLVKNIVKEMS